MDGRSAPNSVSRIIVFLDLHFLGPFDLSCFFSVLLIRLFFLFYLLLEALDLLCFLRGFLVSTDGTRASP